MKNTLSVKNLTLTAMFMALNIALSSFGVPVPGGHFYLNDIVICTFLVGGVGAFLGDLFFYPLPMFVSLATHGIQAIVISLCAHKLKAKHEKTGAIIGVAIGAVIMVVGYSLGRAFIYSTPEYAVMKLPYQILQAAVGAIVAVILCYQCKIRALYLNSFTGPAEQA